MVKEMILVDRDALLYELRDVFDAQTAEVLFNVLNKVAIQIHEAGVSREDFSELKRIAAETWEILRETVEMQRQYEKRFEHVETDISVLKGDVGVLKSDVRVLKDDVGVLKSDVGVLKDDVGVLKSDVRVLKDDMSAVKKDIHVLKAADKSLQDDLGKLKGYSLETRYRARIPFYFGRWLRRPQLVDGNMLWESLENSLTEKELEDIAALDLIVSGTRKDQPEKQILYLAVEISFVVDSHDVQRACQRAVLLRKAGFQAIPVAAGEEMTEYAAVEALQQHVAVLQNGKHLFWDEALTWWDRSAKSFHHSSRS